MRMKYVIGMLAAMLVVVTTVLTLENKKIEYSDFASASSTGRKVQIAGTWVKDRGTEYDSQKNLFRFTMRDEKGGTMQVQFDGAKPNNFELATSMVATGYVEDETFHCSSILTKCPSKYESDASGFDKKSGS